MNLEDVAKAVVSVVTPLSALIGVANRRRRWRAEIKDNLTLIEELRKDEVFRDHTPVLGWLYGKVTVDVARLSGQPLGARKKPLSWSTIITSALLMASLGGWAYLLTRDGWVWYAIFPITGSALFFVALMGSFMNREIPQDPQLPEGAHPLASGTAEERVATSIQMTASGGDLSMYGTEGPAGVALAFVDLMGDGHYDEALQLAEENWLQCRIHARLWNSLAAGEVSREEAERRARALISERGKSEAWSEFVALEAQQFSEAWGSLTNNRVGAASRRRPIAPGYELVILAPVGETSGYFMSTPTALANAMTFLMHMHEGRWLVANHLGSAPPQCGWPPIWWTTGDPAIEALAGHDLT